MKLTRKRSRTAQHDNEHQPAPDQRIRINLHHKTRVVTWNVQTLLCPGTATLLSWELCCYNITLAGLCEVRWQGNGKTTAGNHCYIYSGPKKRTGLYNLALAIPKALRKSFISWTPLSNRLLCARFLHQHGKITIVAYAPTDVTDEVMKDAFLDQFHQACWPGSTTQHYRHPHWCQCQSVQQWLVHRLTCRHNLCWQNHKQ